MSHQHTFNWRPRLFRAFVTNAYYANRDEYDAFQQQQPYTFAEYYRANKAELKQQFKQQHQQEPRP